MSTPASSRPMRPAYIWLYVIVFLVASAAQSRAEKIYLKDGRVLQSQILYCSKGSVWISDAAGTIGIGVEKIDRIENDDGSVSKYDYESIIRRITDYIRQKKYAAAATLCSLLLESFPESANIRYLRANLNQKIDKSEEAITDYAFLIEHQHADPNIFNNLGVMYAQDKNYDRAREFFLKALGTNRNMVQAHDNLAELFMQNKDYQHAIDQYRDVLTLEPDNTRARYNLGVAYLHQGQYAQAKEQWLKVLSIKSDDSDAKVALEALPANK